MAVTQYIGSRYVPLLANPVEWSAAKEYEPLTIVTHEGNSYTSRQSVPKDIDIANEQFWAETGNYNAQIEQYRRETAQAVESSREAVESCREYTDAAVNQVDEWLTDAQDKYGAKPFAFDTVAGMQDASGLLYVGAICHTNGFHASGDGGSAWYAISDNGIANDMDVLACGNLFAALIPTNTFVTPKMFGAVGNGVAADNRALNRMFAYAAEHSLDVIGDENTYIVDDSTSTIDLHYGVLVPGPLTISNLHLKLQNDVRRMCCLLTCKYGASDYRFNGCIFEGVELPSNNAGREDGGNHALFFIDEDTFPDDWQLNFGNIYINNCKFIKTWCYSIFPTPFDGVLSVSNCDFINVYGIGVLSYATNTIVDNCSHDWRYRSDHGMIAAMVHDEIEAFSAPSDIEKNITITNCVYSHSLYRCQENTQYGIKYNNIFISNCKAMDNGVSQLQAQSIVFYSSDDAKQCTYKNIYITDCQVRKIELTHLSNADMVRIINCDTLANNLIQIGCKHLEIIDSHLHAISVVKNCGTVKVINCDINTSSYYGAISSIDSNAKIETLYIVNCTYNNENYLIKTLACDKAVIDTPIQTAIERTQHIVNCTAAKKITECYVYNLHSTHPTANWDFAFLFVDTLFVDGSGVANSIYTNNVTTFINGYTVIS